MKIISLIICTYNRDDLLEPCLSSLVNQNADRELFEVIVVNNNSTDNTQKIAEDFAKEQPNFRVVTEMTQGLSHARNRGYKEAEGDYVAYIDDDAKAPPDWVERILKAFEKVTPSPVAVGGKYHPWYEEPPPPWFTDDIEVRTWGEKEGFLQPPRAQYGFSGSNMAFQKSLLQSYGGFSPGFGMDGGKMGLGEETELFYRIYKDYPLFWYDPKIIVLHLVPARNMTVSYCLRRTFYGGGVVTRIEGSASLYVIIKAILLLTLNICIFPLRVKWWQKNWRRSFIKQSQPIAGAIGFLMTIYKRSGD